MGYRAEKKTVTVRFAQDHPQYGLEAVFQGMDIRTYLRITGMDGGAAEGIGSGIERCAKALVSWNLEDAEGEAVPATEDAFLDQDHSLVIALSGAWFEGLAGVPKSDPLPVSSNSGQSSQEELIQTETLSQSLAS